VSAATRSSRTTALRTVAVTTGEPAGIGPDLCTELLDTAPRGCRLVLIGDRSLIGRARGRRARPLPLPDFDANHRPRAGVELLHVPLAVPACPGVPDVANARYVLETLDVAIGGCAAGAFHAIVTAPVQKSIINQAGIPFTGHTEYLARRTGTPLPVMLLVGGGLRVALATTHLPLRKVSAALTPARLESVLRIVEADLRALFGLRRHAHPRTRPEPARGRKRSPGARGNRRHGARARALARRGARPGRSRAR
jgi:4-hydroxythreonine-4-phosphate dehydrogenase